MSARPAIRFAQEDLELFSQASGDRNPLHLSPAYASRTAYGQQVVFGALGGVACLGHLRPADGERVARITVDFHRPMFLNVDYTVRNSESAGTQSVRLFDGSIPVLTLSATLSSDGASSYREATSEPHFELTEARELAWEQISAGFQAGGRYAANVPKLDDLCRRWNVSGSTLIPELLLWSSYVIGMDLPGRSALFFRVALDLQQGLTLDGAFDYRLSILTANKSASQLRLSAHLTAGGAELASGQLVAFVRPEVAPMTFTDLVGEERSVLPLAGKVAVVVGASRGLGAAIAVAMAAKGARVIALSRSMPSFWNDLPPHIQERITVESADASDAESLAHLSGRIKNEFGPLQFLVCSAFPPIPALRLEPNAYSRVKGYVNQSTDLVLAPLCAFLPLLSEGRGCSVIISSIAVEKPVRDWPHYVAAKNAIEGLGQVAPLQFPETSTMIVRPDRLLTDMTNTPMGRQNALPPSVLAKQVALELQHPPAPGTWRVFHGGVGDGHA